jgi:hypothetical protein
MNDQPTAAPAPRGLIHWFATNRPASGIVLLAAGVAVAVLPVVLAARYGADFLGIEVLTGMMALLLLAAGVWQRFRPADAGRPYDEARMLVLALGGLIGLLVAAAGVVLMIQWWDVLTRWLRQGEREGAWRVLVALAVLLAGLAVMFVSLQAVRTEERSSAGLRRLLYGYNTVLAGVLLFLILAAANVLAYTKLPNLIDSTESGVYKLSDRSIQILRGLDKPTQVYLLMSAQDSSGYDEMTTLLSNAQEYAPRLHVETISPRDTARLRELAKDYPQIEPSGVLVVYGEGKDKASSFIRGDELFKVDRTGGFDSQPKVTFEGEARLMTELGFLAENKQKPVVYFTSNNAGEMDFNDTSTRGERAERAVGVLQQRLAKRNFDVRPLTFSPANPKVPDDATVVVVPAPTDGFTGPAADALRRYVDERKGKLVVLSEVPPTSRGEDRWPATGLEGLLAAYKVQLANERVLSVPVAIGRTVLRDPVKTLVQVAPDAVRSQNPVAVAFKGDVFQVAYSRPVRVSEGPGNPALRAEALLTTLQGLPVFTESSLTARPSQILDQMEREPKQQERLTTRLPLAAVVTESAGPPPSPMGGPPPAAKPRLAVFGSATWVSNPYVDEQSPLPNFDLFVSTLDWLRERPTNIGVEPRTLKTYTMDRSVNPARLLFLPPLLALVAILGLGAGVWVVRRR